MRKKGARWFKRMTAGVVLLAYVAGCTHMPSGEKAFDSFETCFSANLGLAALGGIGAGFLGRSVAKSTTNSNATANVAGVAAGVAAATTIAMTAWRKCAAVYSTSEPLKPQNEPQAALTPAARIEKAPMLHLDRLEMRVEGSENDPPVPEFSFSFVAQDPAVKDVKARFRHKVEIVRFLATDKNELVLADAKGEALLDAAGQPIPLTAASTMPRERLQWIAIAEEGKDDYAEDVVIQQGQRIAYRHKLQIPPRDQLPLPLPVPMRYTVAIEADRMKSTSTVDFALLPSAERPKRFAGSPAVDSAETGVVNASTRALKESAPPAFAATHKARRKVSLFDGTGAKKKTVATLPAGTQVRIEEELPVKNGKTPVWVKVVSEKDVGGWVRASELARLK